MSAIPFKRWGQLSAPIHAGDNFRMARDLSAATRNRPPAKPTGAAYFYGGGVLGVNVVRREAANNHEARCPASTFPSPSSRNPSKVGRASYTSQSDYLGTSPDPYPEF